MHLRSPKSIKIRCKAQVGSSNFPHSSTLPESFSDIWGPIPLVPSMAEVSSLANDAQRSAKEEGLVTWGDMGNQCGSRSPVDPYMSCRVSTIQAGAEIVLENPKRLYDICLWFCAGEKKWIWSIPRLRRWNRAIFINYSVNMLEHGVLIYISCHSVKFWCNVQKQVVVASFVVNSIQC